MKTYTLREFAAIVQRLMALGATRETPVGSSYILGKGADIDVLVLVPAVDTYGAALVAEGWLRDGTTDYPSEWASFRKGEVNAILTADAGWYDRFALAAEVCKALKLADKADRITVHAVIRDGKTAEGI